MVIIEMRVFDEYLLVSDYSCEISSTSQSTNYHTALTKANSNQSCQLSVITFYQEVTALPFIYSGVIVTARQKVFNKYSQTPVVYQDT